MQTSFFKKKKRFGLSQVVDIGEELIRLGHAVSFQEVVNGRSEGDNLGCLQRMLVSH